MLEILTTTNCRRKLKFSNANHTKTCCQFGLLWKNYWNVYFTFKIGENVSESYYLRFPRNWGIHCIRKMLFIKKVLYEIDPSQTISGYVALRRKLTNMNTSSLTVQPLIAWGWRLLAEASLRGLKSVSRANIRVLHWWMLGLLPYLPYYPYSLRTLYNGLTRPADTVLVSIAKYTCML